jgi:pilus assembly protein Flp/PilA
MLTHWLSVSWRKVVHFLQKEDGPTAVEYAVILALIIVVCISAITTLGTNANNTFSYLGTQVGNVGS